jgi:shikimate kinase
VRGVLLIGARGSGKSTVGPHLARLLGLAFHDADARAEEETGRSVAEMLAAGDFRAIEGDVLRRLLAAGPAVVAAGGGAVEAPGWTGALDAWDVVWLDADPAVLANRIRRDPTPRPPLLGDNAADEIGRVREARVERYAALARFRVDTEAADAETLAKKIRELLTA